MVYLCSRDPILLDELKQHVASQYYLDCVKSIRIFTHTEHFVHYCGVSLLAVYVQPVGHLEKTLDGD
jgi:hypothetical protein